MALINTNHFNGNPFPTIFSSYTENEAYSDNMQSYNYFGDACATNSDGTVVVFSAPDNNGTEGSDLGALYAFEREVGSPEWVFKQKIATTPRKEFARTGEGYYSLDMTADGNTLVVAVPGWDGLGGGSPEARNGAIIIFTRTGSTWTQQTIITAEDIDSEISSQSNKNISNVQISGDGTTIVTAIPNLEVNSMGSAGRAWILTTNGSPSSWSVEQILEPDDHKTDHQFGFDVAIDHSGQIVVIGTREDDDTGSPSVEDAGSAYVFKRGNGSPMWQQTNKFIPDNPVVFNDYGLSVSISGNGRVIAVGADEFQTANPPPDQGSVYLYRQINGEFEFEQRINPTIFDYGENFGCSVSLNFDGNVLAVGAHGHDRPPAATNNAGGVFAFVYHNRLWHEQNVLEPVNWQSGEQLGLSCDISGDGATIIGGAPNYEDPAGSPVGFYTGRGFIWTSDT